MMLSQNTPHGSTPYDDGFYLPTDSCRLARVWLPWPSTATLQSAIAAIVHSVTDFAPVSLICSARTAEDARGKIGGAAEIVVLGHQSPRLRDTGPTFLVDGKGGAAAVDWMFNGWGGRGAGSDVDRDFAHALLGIAEVRRFRAPLTLETGSFVADGQDTLLALAPAVFDDARNPRLTRLEAFAIFQRWLGVARVIWVEETHPADRLACDMRALAAFVAPGRVVVSKPEDGPTHAVLARTRHDLLGTRDAQGNQLEIIELPSPPATNLPLSYTSFLAVNGGVLVPGFDAASDEDARAILADAFPDRECRLVPALALARAGISLASLAIPHPARLLERDRASLLPRSAWAQPAPDMDALLQKYIDLAGGE